MPATIYGIPDPERADEVLISALTERGLTAIEAHLAEYAVNASNWRRQSEPDQWAHLYMRRDRVGEELRQLSIVQRLRDFG